MAASLITSFIGTAANLIGAAKQKRLAEQAARQAEIDTQKAFKAIEKSKILDLELPMEQYRRQEQLISQQTRQAVEAAREAGPRGVAAIPRIQAAGTEAFANLGAMQEKALIGLRNLEEQQRVRGEVLEAQLREKAAMGAQTAAAEARAKADALTTSGLTALAGTLGQLTAFDPEKELYPGGQAPFGEGSQAALDGMSIEQSIFGETELPEFTPSMSLQYGGLQGAGFMGRNFTPTKTFGETKVGGFLGQEVPQFFNEEIAPFFGQKVPQFFGQVPQFFGGLFKRK